MLPRVLTITVTRRCNSNCIMCFIWRLAQKNEELSLATISRFLDSPWLRDLVELDLTGGEPLLRKDFPELIAEITRLKEKSLVNLKTLALATNGLRPGAIYRTVQKILSIINGKFDLALVCSLDAMGATHDLIRGIPNAFNKARQTIDKLKSLAQEGLPFWLGVKTTILPHNLDQLAQIMQFARTNGFFHILSPVLFTQTRFQNIKQEKQLALLPKSRQALIDLYSQKEFADCYYPFVLLDTIRRE